MVLSQFHCALCGVSFNIARIRTANEPPESAWGSFMSDSWVDAWRDGQGQCSTEKTGCSYILRQYSPVLRTRDADTGIQGDYLFFDFEGEIPTVGQRLPINYYSRKGPGRIAIEKSDLEHVAGPRCQSYGGYLGHRISAAEMRGCQTFQSLLPKPNSYVQDPDDLDIEVQSNFILSGVTDGMPDPHPSGVSTWGVPERHGVPIRAISDPFVDSYEVSNSAFPFHPWCFGIYMKLSRLRLGHVELDRLPTFFQNINHYSRTFYDCPDPAVTRARRSQWWYHPGAEWLAVNPYYVPKLRDLVHKAMNTDPSFDLQTGVFNALTNSAHTVAGQPVASDIFARLPQEIRDMIVNHLYSHDIAALRLASRAFYQLPVFLWHRLLREEMPWLWEIWTDEPPYFWATVTADDIERNKHEIHTPGMPRPIIVSHTINVQEHLSKWTIPKPPLGRTNWYMLYRDIKRHWNELRGLWNRERIWTYQEEMLVELEKHIRDGA
ncbi:hypothetical protein BDV23DRAFT_171624 [Aspergillus alliaceus]|uniref:F-box domain-containing protein n=1 Tax=Petromyces alliaceus TaxID=209559 RepID=A0A5N7CBB9_PETAA|nr:hypothetical protein BDV23DRAFT_171624 [Aspergillus alliaceus]